MASESAPKPETEQKPAPAPAEAPAPAPEQKKEANTDLSHEESKAALGEHPTTTLHNVVRQLKNQLASVQEQLKSNGNGNASSPSYQAGAKGPRLYDQPIIQHGLPLNAPVDDNNSTGNPVV